MLDSSSESKLNQSLFTIRIIYFAFIISLSILLFIPNITLHSYIGGLAKFKEVDYRLKNILYLLSFLTGGIILILRRFLDNPNKIPLIPKSSFDEILKPLISGKIVLFTLCGTMALYGFVLFLITGKLGEFYFLAGVSFILLLLCFPKREKWEKIVNQFM